MEKQLAEGKLGTVGAYEIDIKESHLIVDVSAGIEVGEAKISVKVSMEKILDKLAEKIPGQIDDAIFAMLKAALK